MPEQEKPPVLQEETGTQELLTRTIFKHFGGCREEVDGERCGKNAEYLLWGKLLPKEALGPRCFDCTQKHVHYSALASRSGWALVHVHDLALDLTAALPSGDGERGELEDAGDRLYRALALVDTRDGTPLAHVIRAAREGWERSGPEMAEDDAWAEFDARIANYEAAPAPPSGETGG